jgi:hypothetical protein
LFFGLAFLLAFLFRLGGGLGQEFMMRTLGVAGVTEFVTRRGAFMLAVAASLGLGHLT